MKAVILSFRRGRHVQKTSQFLLEVKGVETRAKACQIIGKRVVWKTPSGKEIFGKVTNAHGNKGVMRARFSRGLPGTALGTKVEVLEK